MVTHKSCRCRPSLRKCSVTDEHCSASILLATVVETAATDAKLTSLSYFAPGKSTKHCDKRVCLSVFVRYSACISQKPHGRTLSKLVHVDCSRGSVFLWLRYVLPVCWMTSSSNTMNPMYKSLFTKNSGGIKKLSTKHKYKQKQNWRND